MRIKKIQRLVIIYGLRCAYTLRYMVAREHPWNEAIDVVGDIVLSNKAIDGAMVSNGCVFESK